MLFNRSKLNRSTSQKTSKKNVKKINVDAIKSMYMLRLWFDFTKLMKQRCRPPAAASGRLGSTVTRAGPTQGEVANGRRVQQVATELLVRSSSEASVCRDQTLGGVSYFLKQS